MIKSIKNELLNNPAKTKPLKSTTSSFVSNKKPKIYSKVEEYLLREKIAHKLLQQKYFLLKRKYFNVYGLFLTILV